jgi:hypothetical protein
MKHAEFVHQYAAAIDRMMAAKAPRLDLGEDFVRAWRFLEQMNADEYADVEIGQASGGVVGNDLKVLEEQSKTKQAQGVTYAARSRGVSKLISRDEYDMAKGYGAQIVDPLPPGPKA